MQSRGKIELRGVRTHNLKNFDLELRHGELVVITGPSGSGKSSLAFDTIFAEGRRQFLNSLSIKARQALNFLPRPDVDQIKGLPPVVCIDQRKGSPDSRSTVGTLSEIHHYLSLLMVHVGTVKCHQCGRVIDQRSPEEIELEITKLPERSKVMILAPLSRDDELSPAESIEQVRKSGFVRARIDCEVIELEQLDSNSLNFQNIEVVIDRLIVKEGFEDRLSESIARALKFGEQEMVCLYLPPEENKWKECTYSTSFSCGPCNVEYEEVDLRTFNFNSPYGACESCGGTGLHEQFSFDLVLPNRSVSLNDLPLFDVLTEEAKTELRKETKKLAQYFELDCEAVLGDAGSSVLNRFFEGESDRSGFRTLLEKRFVTTTDKRQLRNLEKYREAMDCEVCFGSRLAITGNNVFLSGKTLFEISNLSLLEAAGFLDQVQENLEPESQKVAEPILKEIVQRLRFLIDIGVEYLSLGRRTDTLSGGEHQRIRLANGIGSGLADACYILDEPTVGLHPHDNEKLIQALLRLKETGNTLVVVEHDEAVMRIADTIIDMGPGAGEDGGAVLATGSAYEIEKQSDSITGKHLSIASKEASAGYNLRASPQKPKATKTLRLAGARKNNLKVDELLIPLERFVCVTGVSGSGKSSLIHDTLVPAIQVQLGRRKSHIQYNSLEGVEEIGRVIEIDQQPIGQSSRSNAATFSGLFDEIRKVFAATKLAKQKGYSASRFSFNNKQGACSKCDGMGQLKVEMQLMPDLFVVCDECLGRRYNESTLAIQFKGKNIFEVLDMSVSEAFLFFENMEKIRLKLDAMKRIGLGYLRLGQPASALSGGEAQRLKIATELAQRSAPSTLYVLDEPTTGLHFVDIQRLFETMSDLVDQGAYGTGR